MGDPQTPDAGLIPDPRGLANPLARNIAVATNVEKAKRRMGDAHQRSQQHDARLAAHGTGTDPAYTTSDDHFEGMTHQEIYDNVHGLGGLDPTGMRSMRETWRQCSAEIENLSVFNLMGINEIHHSGMWTGAAAAAGQSAAQQFSDVANETGQVFAAVGERVEAMAWAAEAVRAAVPPPVASAGTPNPDSRQQSIVPGLINPQYLDETTAAQRRARDDAILAMNTIYTPSFPPAGASVPAYPAGTQNPAPQRPDGVRTGPGRGIASSDDAAGGQPGADPEQHSDQPGGSGDGQPPVGAANPAGAGHDSTPAGHDPAATTPTGIGPMAATSTGVGGGHGAGGLPPGGSTAGRPGSGSVSGGPGAPGSPAGPRVAAAGGQAGNGLMSPGLGAPHRPKKEEEREHRSPSYLRGVQPDWLAGLPATVGVIGADTVPAVAAPRGEPAQQPARIRGAGPVLDDPPEGPARR